MVMARSSQLSKELWGVVAILAVALALRLMWVMIVPTQPVTDFAWYLDRALAMARGEGFTVDGVPTAYWPVGYPAVLSWAIRLFPGLEPVSVGKGLNLLLSLFCVGLTFAVGRSISGRREVGLIAAGILAIHPALVAYSGILAAEPLFLFLILLATWLAIYGADQPWLWLLVGLTCGGAALVRPQAAVLPLILVFGVWVWSRQRGKSLLPLMAAGLALLGLGAALTPWTLRNRAVYGSTFLVSLNGGDNLWIGHHPQGNGRYKTPPGIPQNPELELANERATRAEALRWIRSNPGRSLSLIPAKWEATFLSTTDLAYWAFQTQRGKLVIPGAGADKPLYFFTQGAAFWANRTLLFLAFLGVGLGLRHTGGRRFLAVPLLHIGLVALVTAVFFGNPRFGLPAIPFLALLAATPWVPADLDEKPRD